MILQKISSDKIYLSVLSIYWPFK